MASLPSLVLAGSVPAAAVLAVPTWGGADGPAVLGDVPIDVTSLLTREKAKGDAGELVAVPVEDRVLLLGTGDGAPAALRKAGAAIARRAKQQESLALDLRRLELSADRLQVLAEGLLRGSYGFTLKPSAEARPLPRVTVVVSDPDSLREDLQRSLA